MKKSSQSQQKSRRSSDMRILKRAASFYDEEKVALNLIRGHYDDGYIYSSEGRLTVDDFFRSQAEAHALRELCGAKHALLNLELIFKIAAPSGTSSVGTPGRPPNLDDIESVRDHGGQYKAKYGRFTRA
jgi:hypothetical protein